MKTWKAFWTNEQKSGFLIQSFVFLTLCIDFHFSDWMEQDYGVSFDILLKQLLIRNSKRKVMNKNNWINVTFVVFSSYLHLFQWNKLKFKKKNINRKKTKWNFITHSLDRTVVVVFLCFFFSKEEFTFLLNFNFVFYSTHKFWLQGGHNFEDFSKKNKIKYVKSSG